MQLLCLWSAVVMCIENCYLTLKDAWLFQVLVHGSAEATEHLKMHCSKNLDSHVYAPQIEETIDVTSDLCAYKVSILTANSF